MTTADHEDLVVCARFEPSRVVPLWPISLTDAAGGSEEPSNQENERQLLPGETVSLPASLLSADRQPRTETVWIRAGKEGEAKQRTLPKNSILFVLNNHRFPKWFYMYDSSITRTQREMTHHLAVYVCQLSSDGPPASSEQLDAVVLARHASPGFTLVSYRRAGNAGNPGCTLPALTAADDSLQHSSEQSALPSGAMDNSSTVISIPQAPSSNAQQLEMRSDTATEFAAVVHPMGTMNSLRRREGAINGDTDGDAIYWHHDARARESRLAEKGSHLLILWRFLACVSVTDLGVDFGLQQQHVRTHWLRAAATLRVRSASANQHLETIMSSFLRGLWRNRPTESSEKLPDHSQSVIQASADLFLRAFTSRAVQQLLYSSLTPKGDESDKPQLRKRFVTLVSELHGVLDDLLRVVSPICSVMPPGSPISLPALVDEVLSLIYGQRRFGVLRSEVSTLLLAPRPPGSLSEALNNLFRTFTAQMQEAYTTTGLRRRGEVQRPGAWSGDTDTRQSAWSRRWLLEPGSIQVISTSIDQNQDSTFEPSLVEVVHWLHEFACIDIALQDDASCCSIRSVLSLVSERAPKELVLDGRLRVFRVMPSGLSSMVAVAGRWDVGDYVASFSDDTQSLEMTFYAFAEGDSAASGRDRSDRKTTTVRQARVTFVLQQELNAGELSASVDPRDFFIFVDAVVAGAIYVAGDQDTMPKLAEMPNASRLAILRELPWAPMLEMKAGYIAVSIG